MQTYRHKLRISWIQQGSKVKKKVLAAALAPRKTLHCDKVAPIKILSSLTLDNLHIPLLLRTRLLLLTLRLLLRLHLAHLPLLTHLPPRFIADCANIASGISPLSSPLSPKQTPNRKLLKRVGAVSVLFYSGLHEFDPLFALFEDVWVFFLWDGKFSCFYRHAKLRVGYRFFSSFWNCGWAILEEVKYYKLAWQLLRAIFLTSKLTKRYNFWSFCSNLFSSKDS